MSRIYIYVVDRDLGFAPNPFHGMCTLATCKAKLRSTARVGDWIFGTGGGRLKSTGKCIFAMKVTQKLTYNEYWESADYRDKIPVRNGSKVMMLGDNIYHYDPQNELWSQAHSHHSNSDGTINEFNKKKDTVSDKVLVSKHFYYFGRCAVVIPEHILEEIGYSNRLGHRVFDFDIARGLVNWVENSFNTALNLVSCDPFDFERSEVHYSYQTNKMS
jgi:hypothetical protein